MKVLLLMGRGVEGTGQTRTAIEIQSGLEKQGHQVTSIANTEKKWGRAKSQDHSMRDHDFSKYPLLDSDSYDHVIICSVPSIKYSDRSCDNFTQLLEDHHEDNAVITYVQVDHLAPSIRRNYYSSFLYTERFFKTLDHIVTHSKDNAFTKYATGLAGDYDFKTHEMMFISCDFDSLARFIKPLDVRIDNLCYFLGRSARWKGPYALRDFHHQYLKAAGFTTILDGMEASIGYLDQMYKTLKPRVERDDVELHLTANPDDYMKRLSKHEAMFFGPYVREQALQRASRSEFGMFFTYIGDEAAGPIENTLMELVGVGLVPVVRKKLYDSAKFIDGRLSSHDPSEIGFVVVDEDNPQEAVGLMMMLRGSFGLYKSYQDKSYQFLRSNFNQARVIGHFWSLINE